MQLFLTITLCLIIGAATAYYATLRGRDPLIWFMVGMLLGIFGLALLFILPPVNKTQEETAETIESAPAPRPISHDYMIKDWFYYDRERNQIGPIRFERLKELWKNSEISAESFVWSEGMPEWQKLEEVHGLYTHLTLG